MERFYVALTDWVSVSIGGGVGGVRVGRSFGGALVLGAVVAGTSKGVGG